MKSKIQVIYNSENGDLYCAASSVDLALKIIDEDSARGDIVKEDHTIVELNYFTEESM